MTYELDCFGARLIIRIFPPNGVSTEWKVEARANEGADAVVATATGTSPSSALESVAQWWRDNATARALATYDWTAIAQAMAAVRAI